MKKNFGFHYIICFLFLLISLCSCKKEQVSKSPELGLTTNTDGMVATPNGWVPKDRVFLVEPDCKLAIDSGHVFKISKNSGAKLQDLGTIVMKSETYPKTTQSDNAIKGNDGSTTESIFSTHQSANQISDAYTFVSGSQQINLFQASYAVPANPPTAS